MEDSPYLILEFHDADGAVALVLHVLWDLVDGGDTLRDDRDEDVGALGGRLCGVAGDRELGETLDKVDAGGNLAGHTVFVDLEDALVAIVVLPDVEVGIEKGRSGASIGDNEEGVSVVLDTGSTVLVEPLKDNLLVLGRWSNNGVDLFDGLELAVHLMIGVRDGLGSS